MTAAAESIDAKIALLVAMRDIIADPDFGTFIKIVLSAPGRIVVTGMGKSGHIGRKLAATFQSTGQRAAFMCPAAAAHGDMGIIESGDVVLMLTNSGSTEELGAVMDFCAETIPVAIITANADASLARRAHIVLAYPFLPEGCPIGKAPMASACAQLAIGDAIAAELMSRRGFGTEDFLRFHHGGYLGKRLSAVA